MSGHRTPLPVEDDFGMRDLRAPQSRRLPKSAYHDCIAPGDVVVISHTDRYAADGVATARGTVYATDTLGVRLRRHDEGHDFVIAWRNVQTAVVLGVDTLVADPVEPTGRQQDGLSEWAAR